MTTHTLTLTYTRDLPIVTDNGSVVSGSNNSGKRDYTVTDGHNIGIIADKYVTISEISYRCASVTASSGSNPAAYVNYMYFTAPAGASTATVTWVVLTKCPACGADKVGCTADITADRYMIQAEGSGNNAVIHCMVCGYDNTFGEMFTET